MTVRPLPWTTGRSIYEVVAGTEGSREVELPDEPPVDPTKIRWSAGSWEGVATRHIGPPEDAGRGSKLRRLVQRRDAPGEIVARLRRLARHPADDERLAVYRIARDHGLLEHVDAVIERLARDRDLLESLAPHARWLVTEARHRGPLKLGIALLGVCGLPADADLVKVVARHDEFTLYAAVALRHLLADPLDALWEVARTTHGWGKIEAVGRLAPHVEHRPDIQRWLLTDGCKNSVMDEYLGYACATGGRLAGALRGDVDDSLLDGACVIVAALCIGGPAEDMSDYDDGPVAVERLLDHLAERCTSLSRLDAVIAIRRWLEDCDWSDDLRVRLRTGCDEILGQPEWPDRVRAAYDDPDSWGSAWYVAPHVGVDLWDEAFRRLTTGGLDAAIVSGLMTRGDGARQARVVAWAEEHLPLDDLATGPERNLFPAPETGDLDFSVSFIVQEMSDGDLYSERLVAAALRAPVVVTRNMALNALEARPRERWGPAVEEALRRSLEDEPDEQVRERVAGLAAG